MTPKEALKPIKEIVRLFTKKAEIENFDDEFNLIEQALNDLERLKKFKETFDNYELAKRQDFIAYENWLECENELAELKRDVKRYFELGYIEVPSTEQLKEYLKLQDKLLEVGKEE